MADKTLPLVYSCSGCSSAAQLANAIALKLNRDGSAEMSCIAGVGGGVAPLVRLAKSGRTILAIDGCPLACVRECLAQQGVTPNHHLLLNEHGVRKRCTPTLIRPMSRAWSLRRPLCCAAPIERAAARGICSSRW